MNIVLLTENGSIETGLIEDFRAGLNRHGLTTLTLVNPQIRDVPTQSDLVVFVGVKYGKFYNALQEMGINTLLIDKGYFQRVSTKSVVKADGWKLALNGFQSKHLDKVSTDPQRLLNDLGIQVRPTVVPPGECVIYVASSDKYHNWHGHGDVFEYGNLVCQMLRRHTKKPILYRPKPSWWSKDRADHRVPEGTQLSDPRLPFSTVLRSAYMVVTHGSNAATEAAIQGIPFFVVEPESGANAMAPLAESDYVWIDKPRMASQRQRTDRLAQLAHCQFTYAEIACGLAWDHVQQYL